MSEYLVMEREKVKTWLFRVSGMCISDVFERKSQQEPITLMYR